MVYGYAFNPITSKNKTLDCENEKTQSTSRVKLWNTLNNNLAVSAA